MGVLFQDGYLLFDSNGYVLFSDDPYDCECCNPIPDCVCPEDADFAAPKYVDEYEVVISDIPNTYNELRTSNSSNPLGTGNSEITLQLSGFAALNGTYATSLKQNDDGTSCTASNSECVFNDVAANCFWEGNLMRVSITGTLNYYSFEQLFGNPPFIDERTYNLFGTAAIGAGSRPQEILFCNVAAYTTVNGVCRAHGNLGFVLEKIAGNDALSFGNFPFGNIERKRFTCTTGDLYYNDPPDIEPWAIIPSLFETGFFGRTGLSVFPCNTEGLAPAAVPAQSWGPWCNEPDCDYTIAMSVDNCSGSYSFSNLLGGLATTNITFAYDGFACTIDSNCTLLP